MTEKRLIDADDLLIAFGNALNNATLKIGYGFMEQESLRGHAKWVKDKELKFIIVDDENNSHEEPAICCTHCKAKISQSDFDSWVWTFCPVCGFKMEDETD